MPGPATLHTHTYTHSVLFCMCVYCHLAIRLQDSGVSQVRAIYYGLGSRCRLQSAQVLLGQMTDCPRRNMQCKQRWNKANHASNCRVATIIENLLPPPHITIHLPPPTSARCDNHQSFRCCCSCVMFDVCSGEWTRIWDTRRGYRSNTHSTHHTHTPHSLQDHVSTRAR